MNRVCLQLARSIALLATLSLVAMPALGQAVADKPTPAVGDSWAFSTTTDTGKETKEISWTRKLVAVGADGGMDVQVGPRVLKNDASGNLIDPKGPEYSRTPYRFPMKVGAEWSFVTKLQGANIIDQRNQYKVVAFEPVTVPAGTFDCFKVEGKAEASYSSGWQQRINETYWYCPKLNFVAKIQREMTTQSRESGTSREKSETVLTKFLPKG